MQNAFFLTNWIFEGMKWVNSNISGGSIFITILIWTVLLKVVMIPSDISTRKSSLKTAALQPKIQKLQKKYKDDPRRLQAEQSKLMKENGVSMLGGCLPMLIMMPLFFCFIAAFRYWGYEQMVQVLLELNEKGSSEMFQKFQFLWIHNIWQADNGMYPVIMKAEQFLATKDLQNLLFFRDNPAALDTFRNLGFIINDVKNIPADAITKYNQLVQPIMDQYTGYGNGWFILPILAAGTQFLSAWIMQKNQPATQQQQNKSMMYIFPIMSFVFCLSNTSAFAIYWVISSVASIVSNIILNKAYANKIPTEELKGE